VRSNSQQLSTSYREREQYLSQVGQNTGGKAGLSSHTTATFIPQSSSLSFRKPVACMRAKHRRKTITIAKASKVQASFAKSLPGGFTIRSILLIEIVMAL
jgi:hypothetical protein